MVPPPFRAQLATLTASPPKGEQWLHELKYDGYRMACEIDRGSVRLISRRGREWTNSFPELVAAAKALPVESALLDGEVAIVLPNGTTSFQALQNAFAGAARTGLTYFVFDLLYLDGRNVALEPLERRKAQCEGLMSGLPLEYPLKYSRHFDADGPTLLARACDLGAEGIVSKRRDMPYRPGRNETWLKSKCSQRQEFVIGGFTDPEGTRAGIGALLIGYHQGGALRFGGKVGTGPGFTAKYLAKMRSELEQLETDACPFEPRPPGWLGRNAHWIEPKLTGEVVFREWTAGGHVRHGSFLGIRRDKLASKVVRELPALESSTTDQLESARSRKGGKRAAGIASEPTPAQASVLGVPITTPNRLVYPELRYTKLDMARLYADLAELALPYMENRPLTLVRCEKGVRAEDALRRECGFLKHEPGWHRWAKPPIRRVQIQEQKKLGEYLVVDSAEGLVALVQGDIVELHVWNATVDRMEQPDRIVFDLDPGEDVTWPRVLDAARLLRTALEKLGLECWPKLTGGKGLHIVLPFLAEHGWPEVYAFSRAVAESIVREQPESLTLDFAKAGRRAKILVDYKRNHRAAVAVAAYSTRANPTAALSVPVAWSELKPSLLPQAFNVHNVRGRLNQDPWRDYWHCKQRLG